MNVAIPVLSLIFTHFNVQKQSSRGVIKENMEKRFSENMQRIYRGTPMPKCAFNKVTLQ